MVTRRWSWAWRSRATACRCAPEVFPGNTVDAATLAQIRESLRGWVLGHAIFVGDAGMDSEANRHELAKGLGHGGRSRLYAEA